MIVKNKNGFTRDGEAISKEAYDAVLAQIKAKADLVSRLSAGSIQPEDVPEEWREEITVRAEARKQEAQAEAQEATAADYQDALEEMGCSFDD